MLNCRRPFLSFRRKKAGWVKRGYVWYELYKEDEKFRYYKPL